MTGPSREVAAVRLAVRRALEASGRGRHGVLVACSGGGDSLALAGAARFVASRLGVACGLVTVDHQLQEGSAERAAELASWARSEEFSPVLSVAVEVAGRSGGPEAAAREARYEALCKAAHDCGGATVLLGHTQEDQAETVLLALARGGGPRGLAGMPAIREVDGITFLRPLLGLTRAEVRAAGAEMGLKAWEDPHNADPAFARARVRSALPVLIDVLGAGVVANLARTAALVADDTAALDELAERAVSVARVPAGLAVDVLLTQPAALRTRVLRLYAAELGAGALSQRHIAALDTLVTDWHGQGPVGLPGGVLVGRSGGLVAPVRG
ncbi:tRNA lysidine(34) synthetase TilS [Virgisporangium aurantiacum]|uniref:tRNA(Ile)-lysidine synthase n=1 Tax=Virgisporangium aurantiacum TaxID=175570 RepID=A0A8J3YZZ0_9ACTN|nr:tRNA lysidine(34) synthetase TilS [Virgisporangium aurantiacum]GIJ53867.1 tRNA(Ile)-lysidine synthase [Virgisporangium aurantiacum]